MIHPACRPRIWDRLPTRGKPYVNWRIHFPPPNPKDSARCASVAVLRSPVAGLMDGGAMESQMRWAPSHSFARGAKALQLSLPVSDDGRVFVVCHYL